MPFDYLPPHDLPNDYARDFTPIVHERVIDVVHERVIDDQTLARKFLPSSYLWDGFEEIPLADIAKQQLLTLSQEEMDNHWCLNDFFGTIAVINLPQDTKRLERITEELTAIGTQEFDIFPAIDGRKYLDASIWMKFHHNRAKFKTNSEEGKRALERMHQGEAGCYMSHYLLIKRTKEAFDQAIQDLHHACTSHDEAAIAAAKAQARKYSSILILEDDNGFGIVDRSQHKSSKKTAGKLLRQALSQLPKHWDMLYFMCSPRSKTKKASRNLQKVGYCVYMNAYAVNYTMYASLMEELKKIEDPNVSKVYPVDKAASRIYHRHRVFAIYPAIAFQFGGISSIDSTSKPTLTQCQPR